jgi:hypothetical protein
MKCKHSFHFYFNEQDVKHCEWCQTAFRFDEGEWHEIRCQGCNAIRNEACSLRCPNDFPEAGTFRMEKE